MCSNTWSHRVELFERVVESLRVSVVGGSSFLRGGFQDLYNIIPSGLFLLLTAETT